MIRKLKRLIIKCEWNIAHKYYKNIKLNLLGQYLMVNILILEKILLIVEFVFLMLWKINILSKKIIPKLWKQEGKYCIEFSLGNKEVKQCIKYDACQYCNEIEDISYYQAINEGLNVPRITLDPKDEIYVLDNKIQKYKWVTKTSLCIYYIVDLCYE